MERLDLKLINGGVADGTGTPVRPAQIGIQAGRIVAVAERVERPAVRELDCSGCLVAPGFIDAHTHSDTYLLIEPGSPSKVHQGVTTEVIGNCGASAAPLRGDYRLPSDWRDKTYPASWRTVAEFRQVLMNAGPAVNVVFLAGHNTLHAGVAGYANRPVTARELLSMQTELELALASGARGMSTGLLYAPGLFAGQDEILALARLVAAAGGVYASHMRSEGDALLDALAETLSVGRQTGVRVQISHLKTAGRANWGKLDAALAQIESAQADGVAVAADRYPYCASATDLDVVLPTWAQEGGPAQMLKRLEDPLTCNRIREEMVSVREAPYWETIWIGSTLAPENLSARGRKLIDVAAERGMPPAEMLLELVRTDRGMTSAFFAGMSEQNMQRILEQPYVMPGSDASLRAPEGPLSMEYPHPRAYGTFPRYWRCMRDTVGMDAGEIVRRMTSLPAQQFGLENRGELRPGCAADVTVFHPDVFCDRADYACPHVFAEGVRHLLVNGRLTIYDGEQTEQRGGQWL